MENTKIKSSEYWQSDDTGRLLSEQESSKLVGVSLETIQRYQEFGLLKPVVRNNLPFYRERELKSLFLITSSPTEPVKEQASDAHARSERDSEQAENAKSVAEPKKNKAVFTLSDLLSERLAPVGEILKIKSEKPLPQEKQSEAEQVEESPKAPPISSPAPVPAIRLQDMMAENKSLKDKLKSLEDERDWLRKRVEQLEERSGREQMLLLTEKETLREVLNATVVRSALTSSYAQSENGNMTPVSIRAEQKKPEVKNFRLLSKIRDIFS